MKNLIIAAAGIALASTTVTLGTSAQAAEGPFSGLKKAAKKVENAAKDVERADRAVKEAKRTKGRSVLRGAASAATGGYVGTTAGSNYPRTASRGDYLGRPGAAPAKYASMTQCANTGLGNAFVAVARDYTFSKGLSTETRSGLIEREPVSPSNGCVLPGMGSGEVVYLEVDTAKYNKYDYALQCISFDGSEQLDNTNAPRTNNYSGQHVMLHTGHSLGYTPTASGRNSDRGAAYDKHLESRGRSMITFNMPELHTDKGGTDFYCQHYNEKTGQSLVAFTYRRGPVGRP
ncbi:hypothetical protein ACFCW2_02675 [Qipengyuania sp. DSG2-2]|uniref:hypothetical protein n=1 Tax=Qipengyuania sp. DGS2-2 TaxID=3349631 RepID=UPI0036D3A8F9